MQPGRCAPVRISADEIVADHGNDRGLSAIANFSGGIDSTFTVLRHSLNLCGMDTVSPAAALIVHGFDVPLADEAGFKRLLDRLRPIWEEHNLQRYVVRTNLKEMAVQNWLDSYPAQLVCCLHTVSHRHSTALVASDGYAQSPSFEFGGNPIAVPLLSTSRLKVLYDGGQIGRTDKVTLLAKYPQVRRSLKFCWQGPDPDRNCGRCPKCLLTYLNFRAVGIERPECFDSPVSDDAVGTFTVRNNASLPLAYEVLEHLWKSPSLAGLAARFHAPIAEFEQANGMQPTAQRPPEPPAVTFPVCHPIRLDAVSALNGGMVHPDRDFTTIRTDPRDWAYSAGVGSKHFAGIAGPGRIEIRLQADQGKVGVLVLNRGSSDQLVVPEQCVGTRRGRAGDNPVRDTRDGGGWRTRLQAVAKRDRQQSKDFRNQRHVPSSSSGMIEHDASGDLGLPLPSPAPPRRSQSLRDAVRLRPDGAIKSHDRQMPCIAPPTRRATAASRPCSSAAGTGHTNNLRIRSHPRSYNGGIREGHRSDSGPRRPR